MKYQVTITGIPKELWDVSGKMNVMIGFSKLSSVKFLIKVMVKVEMNQEMTRPEIRKWKRNFIKNQTIFTEIMSMRIKKL